MSIAGVKPSCTTIRMVVRSVNWLGDAVMSTPALLRLREAYPNAFIALLTPQKLADLWKNHPALSVILTFAPSEGPLRVGRRLRHEGFQTALVLPNSFRSAWETWWARIPQRVGYAGQLRTWLLTQAVPPRPGAVRMRKRTRPEVLRLISGLQEQASAPGRTPVSAPPAPGSTAHHIHEYLHLAACLGANPKPLAPQVFVQPSEVETALRRLQIPAVPKRPLFALNPGAEYGPAKRWPADRFIAAARAIQMHTGCQWLVLGGQGDRDLAGQVAAGIQLGLTPAGESTANDRSAINLAGATSLRELCAVLSACDLLLTNDTGPMHVAAAVNTRVVTPFGSTSPALTAPGMPGDARHGLLQASVPCAPCFLRQCPIDFRCMRSIEVDDVVQAVLASPP